MADECSLFIYFYVKEIIVGVLVRTFSFTFFVMIQPNKVGGIFFWNKIQNALLSSFFFSSIFLLGFFGKEANKTDWTHSIR